MFNPKSKNDRLNYREIICPPNGYELDKAIGTTYSLDLETLTFLCFAFSVFDGIENQTELTEELMIQVLEEISDKILVFCQKGQIKLPSNRVGKIAFLLEKMVVEVMPEKGVFHPKTWTISYKNKENEDDKIYRYIVLSRNLTFDRSWDSCVVLDGRKNMQESSDKTKPIIHFLEYLKRKTDILENKEFIEKFWAELSQVVFKTDDKVYNNFEIKPLGIGKGYNIVNDDLFLRSDYQKIAIMSPFIKKDIIEKFNNKGENIKQTIITRRSELYELNQVNDIKELFDVYVLKSGIIEHIPEGEESPDEYLDFQKQDIHAKIFVKEYENGTDVYLGSMNATNAACNQNVEMVIRLKSDEKLCDSFLSDIFLGESNGSDNPFEKISLDDIPNDETEAAQGINLEQAFRDICQKLTKATVTGDKIYSVEIEINDFSGFQNEHNDIELSISSVKGKHEEKIESDKVTLKELTVDELSVFYRLKLQKKLQNSEKETIERLVTIPTDNIPDTRDKDIKNQQFANADLSALVRCSLGDVLGYIQLNERAEKLGSASGAGNGKYLGISQTDIYETLLKKTIESKDRILALRHLCNCSIEEGKNKDLIALLKTFIDAIDDKQGGV